jgi:hypothetical protein
MGNGKNINTKNNFFLALSLCLVEAGEGKEKKRVKKKKQEMINDGWNGEENLFLMYVWKE